jgi:hypothetical protein
MEKESRKDMVFLVASGRDGRRTAHACGHESESLVILPVFSPEWTFLLHPGQGTLGMRRNFLVVITCWLLGSGILPNRGLTRGFREETGSKILSVGRIRTSGDKFPVVNTA